MFFSIMNCYLGDLDYNRLNLFVLETDLNMLNFLVLQSQHLQTHLFSVSLSVFLALCSSNVK